MGKATVENEKYGSLKRNVHKDKTENGKYYREQKQHQQKSDVKDVSENYKLARRHRHHHHRRHHHHSRHHHRQRETDNGKQDISNISNISNTPTKSNTDEDAAEVISSKQINSPGMLSVSSSHSSLSTPHYSHSPAVIVDNEATHGHNSTHSSINSQHTPSPKRLSSSRSNSEADLETESSAHSSKRSKKSENSENSLSESSDDEPTNDLPAVVEDTSLNNNGKEEQEEKEEEGQEENKEIPPETTLPDYFPGVSGCRSVEEFQCLNRIEEGTYGVVYRAKDKKTSELVALKRLKMEKETEGFPITSLREINTLLKAQHPNIVTVREIVVGSNMDQIFIVMDYVEHDMKSLMQTMRQRKQSFLPSEIKCLTQQLLRAVAHMHDNWILHRDLKTSNLLLSHKGVLKVADFGLAREYGSPLKNYTPVVVTLWYRAPELLLCSPIYSTSIDMWSVGCIFAEWLLMRPLFTGEKEIDQLNRIFKELGTPNEKIWKGYTKLPGVKNILSQNSQFTEYPISSLRKRFLNVTTEVGINFLQGMLTYDPEKRLTAERALNHEYFNELPLPIDPSMFPTWPAKSELGDRKKVASPKPPPGGSQFKKLAGLDIPLPTTGAGFQLKF